MRASSGSPRACSGDMYATVPMAVPGLVRCFSSIAVGRAVSPGAAEAGLRVLGETEVEDLRLPAFRDEDVRGLDVAVHDPPRVRRLERVGDLRPQVEQRLELERPGPEPVPQRLAVEELHRDEGLALVLVDVVDRADVGVLERRGRARFALQPLERLRVPAPAPPAGTSTPRGGRASDPRLRRRRPCRRRRASRGSGSARPSGRSWRGRVPLRQELLLLPDRLGADRGELGILADRVEGGIPVHRRVGEVVALDGAPQSAQSRRRGIRPPRERSRSRGAARSRCPAWRIGFDLRRDAIALLRRFPSEEAAARCPASSGRRRRTGPRPRASSPREAWRPRTCRAQFEPASSR